MRQAVGGEDLIPMATFNPTDLTYDIPKITGVCAASNRALVPGEKYFAVLLDPPPEARALPEGSEKQEDAKPDNLGFIRRDVALEAWENGWRPPYLFSYWQSEVDMPGAKKKMFVDDTTLTQMLRDLEGAVEPSRAAFRYMVALILMRKKKLRFEGIERREDPTGDGPVQEWWIFTPKEDPSKGHFGRWKDDEKIIVLDPRLQESDAESMVEHLTEILGSDFANIPSADNKAEAKKESE